MWFDEISRSRENPLPNGFYCTVLLSTLLSVCLVVCADRSSRADWLTVCHIVLFHNWKHCLGIAFVRQIRAPEVERTGRWYLVGLRLNQRLRETRHNTSLFNWHTSYWPSIARYGSILEVVLVCERLWEWEWAVPRPLTDWQHNAFHSYIHREKNHINEYVDRINNRVLSACALTGLGSEPTANHHIQCFHYD